MYIREFEVTTNATFKHGWELFGYQKEFIGAVQNVEAMAIGLGRQFLFDDMLFNVVDIERLEGETRYHLDEVRPAPIKLEV
ncbi:MULTISPECIES: hypothetical protein [Bacillus cereus group]|uniref:Uncharacterized protein n=1 Tax=Bacillus thuringiensis TaxID=1428 RepID=A0A9X7ASH2_BACTU|nr:MULTISPECIES: hypothetical protein [Bacillus cereus group]EKS7858087.1 hypothetical protein [Bacillus cereus]PEV64206.1 hypothetical protein CN434_25695 [Bacillus thuringiensis]PFT50767.1 hypothetical protein COK72_01830 [Bacillus thuringiensis]PFY22804.1 hypothetical protein COL44_18150 [Bacillus toyonensis]